MGKKERTKMELGKGKPKPATAPNHAHPQGNPNQSKPLKNLVPANSKKGAYKGTLKRKVAVWGKFNKHRVFTFKRKGT